MGSIYVIEEGGARFLRFKRRDSRRSVHSFVAQEKLGVDLLQAVLFGATRGAVPSLAQIASEHWRAPLVGHDFYVPLREDEAEMACSSLARFCATETAPPEADAAGAVLQKIQLGGRFLTCRQRNLIWLSQGRYPQTLELVQARLNA